MKAPSLSPRDRTFLVAGSAVVALILLLGRGTPRLRELYATERAIAAEQRLALVLAEQSVVGLGSLPDSARALERALTAWRSRTFLGSSINAGTAGAVSYLGRLATSHHVDLGAVQVQRDSSARRGFVTITLSVSLTADIHGLAFLLADLESGAKLWRVRSMSITQPDVAASQDEPEALSVQLVVQALSAIETP